LWQQRTGPDLLELHGHGVPDLKLTWLRTWQVGEEPDIGRLLAFNDRDDERLILLHQHDARVVHHEPGIDDPSAAQFAEQKLVRAALRALPLWRVLILFARRTKLRDEALLIDGIPERFRRFIGYGDGPGHGYSGWLS
jgi:hypothetical protein